MCFIVWAHAAFEEAEKNAPAIIFIDELDAIAPKREKVCICVGVWAWVVVGRCGWVGVGFLNREVIL